MRHRLTIQQRTKWKDIKKKRTTKVIKDNKLIIKNLKKYLK